MPTEFSESIENEVPDVPVNLNDASPIFEKRGPGFTMTEDVIVCKAFISTSEDPIAGRAQKGKVFKNKMFIVFNLMMSNQATYEKTMLSNASSSTKQTFLTAGSGGVYPKRKEDSIFERFTKKNSPEVSKFMGILETTDMESGENEEDHKNNCLNLYLQRYGKTFDFTECYEYLKDKTKFLLYKNKQNEPKKDERPIGNKMAKKAQQDAALIKLALDGLKDPPPISDVSTISIDENMKKSESAFYQNATNFLTQTGEALRIFMQQQQDSNEKQNEKEFLNMLGSPEKKVFIAEKMKLYISEMRAKRRKLEDVEIVLGDEDDSE